MNRILILLKNTLAMAIISVIGSASLAQADQREVVIEAKGENFQIISQTILEQDPPKVYRLTLADTFYYIEAKDAQGNVVEVQSMPDFSQVVFDYLPEPPLPTEAREGHRPVTLSGGKVTPPKTQFVVHLSDNQAITQLQISRQSLAPVPQGTPPSTISIDPTTNRPNALPKDLTLVHVATLDLGQTTIGGQK